MLKANAQTTYEGLLGPRAISLDPRIRRLHVEDGDRVATGRFVVRRMGRVRSVHVRLAITREVCGEIWVRELGERRIVSHQWQDPAGVLVERVGPVELRFRLRVEDGGIRFVHQRSALTAGRARIPLPRWIGPRVEASVMPAGPDAVRVRVVVGIAGAEVLAYEGDLEEVRDG